MNKYKIIIAYDGTDYFGWQVQRERPSIAQTLEDTFARVFNKKIHLRAASRTDAGVHALGQVTTFTVDIDITPELLLHAWRNLLPPAIVIQSIEQIPIEFNVHANIIGKTYWYHFVMERPLPFKQRYSLFYRHTVDIKKLEQCLNVFLGTHDFRSFSTGDDRGDDTIRHIDGVSVSYCNDYQAYKIAITGPKFLKYMIRRIVGACLEVASRKNLEVAILQTVLEAKNPEHLLPNAPAKGLTLYKIDYNSGVAHEQQ